MLFVKCFARIAAGTSSTFYWKLPASRYSVSALCLFRFETNN